MVRNVSILGAAAAIVLLPLVVSAQPCPGGRLLLLTNGKIHTMDAKRTVVSKVRIGNGKFVEVGDAASASGGCTDTIDLRGRAVIPGMIDNHFHVQLVGSRPGYETRTIETAFSIAEVQNVIRERAKNVPEGAFITAIGGLQPRQFAENRMPTLAELDAAAPRHPVYIHVTFNGPAATNSLAQHRWQMMEHSFDEANHATRADVWERVNREFPIAGLRWTIDHVNTITPATIARMKALGVGVRAHGWRVLAGSPGQAGPPYRMLLDSGIRVGAGMDGAQASPINPWMHVYYMVTGRNVRGDVINVGQQITRQEAVWLYTGANGWFSREEDTIGTIAAGRLADLVVLNADVFDPKVVSDEDIRRVHSVLTILGGRIVHGDQKALR